MCATVVNPVQYSHDVQVEGYELVGEIGRGGAGTVYLARQNSLGRLVAMKVLSTRDPELAARLVAEARVLAELDDPHIVSVIDVGDGGGGVEPWYTMTYCGGGTLADVLGRDGTVTPGQAVTLGVAVARGLSTIHRRDIVHRDVKPGNILLTDRGNVLLGDLGTALDAHAERVTTTGAVLGTVGYAAPELIAGDEPTSASDVFSLGVVLYEALAGFRPYRGGHIAAVMDAIRSGIHVPLHEAAPSVPAAIADLVEQALAVDPARRPDNLDEWAGALGAAHTAEPLVAAPPAELDGSLTTTVGALRTRAVPTTVADERPRRRWPVVIGAAVALALALGGVAAWLATRDEADAQLANVSVDLSVKRPEPGVSVASRWSFADGEVLGRTLVTNSTALPVSFVHDEIIPKRLIGDAADITAQPRFDSVVEADPIVRYCLEIAPGDDVVLNWSGPLSDDEIGAAELNTLADEWSSTYDTHLRGDGGQRCPAATNPSTTTTSSSTTSTTTTSTTVVDSGAVDTVAPVVPATTAGGRPVRPTPTTAATPAPTPTPAPTTTTAIPTPTPTPPPSTAPPTTQPPAPRTNEVPNVIGSDFSAGAGAVQAAGFNPTRNTVDCTGGQPSSQIIDYSPKGTQPLGTTVSLTVCR